MSLARIARAIYTNWAQVPKIPSKMSSRSPSPKPSTGKATSQTQNDPQVRQWRDDSDDESDTSSSLSHLNTSLESPNVKRFADMIKGGEAKNIVILTGAGISTSAGIPDFRSPETGLYHNLQQLKLPFPEAVFELGYFKSNPKPFWTLARELYPGKHFPTPTHYFFHLLHKHRCLRRVFSQNIDTLELAAGLPPDRVIEAHGSFATAHCLKCRREASRDEVLRAGVRRGEIVKCGRKGCGGLVKPDIVFFGEGLPNKFFDSLVDLEEADLLIIIGTSLQVHPFASLINYVGKDVPRLLINREAVGPFARLQPSGENKTLEFFGGAKGDALWQGDSDEGVRLLAEALGWADELNTLIEEGRKELGDKWKTEESLHGGQEAAKRAEEAQESIEQEVESEEEDLEELVRRELRI